MLKRMLKRLSVLCALVIALSGCDTDFDDKPSTGYNGGPTPNSSVPTVPTNVTATAVSSSSITVSWSSVSGATGYYVYRATNDSGSYSRVGSPASTSYTDTGLPANTPYYYKVSAYNSYGESGQSNYAYATTSSSTPSIPSAPTNVTATRLSANNVLVTWDAVSGATHYEVYWAETASGEYSLDGTPTSTSFTSTNWGANESGCFKIKAVNSAGSSGYSSIAFFGPYSSGGSAPSTPTGVTATAVSSSSITISWYSVSGATGYDVYRADSSYGSYSYIGYSTSTSYTDTGLSANTPYYYKVAAYNSYDESGQSSYTSATTSGSVPSTPTGVTATAVSSSSITVSWSSVSGATGYDVYRADSSYGSYSYIGYSTSTSYTDTGRSANTTYYYKVAAYNNYGTSGQSSYDYATTSSSTPSIGSSLTQGYWRDGEIYYSAQYYYFYATSGSLYTVFWNDYDGDGSKTGDIVVSAYWDSDNTSIFSEDSGYNGKTFTASKTGYVMLKVEPYDYYSSGTFAIKYQ